MNPETTTEPTPIVGIDEITPSWMQAGLRRSGLPDAVVTAVSHAPIGAGNVSDCVRVEITYDGNRGEAPESVVVKLRPSDPGAHQHGLNSGAYHREIGAFRAIGERLACRIPSAYWVAGDETNINLVTEDLTRSAVPGNQAAGSNAEEAEAVIVELARVHSAFAPTTPESAPDWMIRLADVCDYWSDHARAGAEAALGRYTDALPPEYLDVIRDGADIVRDWHLLPQQRWSFTHGDPRVDNVLFEQVGGKPSAVLIDWQVTGVRNPMYDVGYFMSGSVDTDLRREIEMPLIRRYIEVYSRQAAGYDVADAVCDYQIQLLSGLYITLAAIDVLPDNDVVNALILALLRRNCAAVIDWKSVAAVRNVLSALSIR
ncbi:phosphotransferase [Gordonia amarae]|uniref:CHK kinase-like domain-containing protein n=2 Tax=Gordonia amarae TaxID=36821 RepID=G7GNN2_9ACTN|nr:aminoglycoside phosphotransferase family protein [Gordonia amarae]MCS3878207.1 hypothetical protein [Gordonia amarae]QHN16873.1 phosphotransferase [Gordonia amarae]QHN21398.1 phosphotransferase [Gordonia amarae]QHN30249.1 phosphotransferase [Gordonia amarae]QHN39025.1 phosphotransferase [Gordonia amarae]